VTLAIYVGGERVGIGEMPGEGGQEAAQSAAVADRPCVLVVEDDQQILDVIEQILQIEGFDVVGTGRADMVLGLARQAHPQLVICDIMLSGDSGIEVAIRLRDSGFGETPMLALSELMLSFAQQSGIFDACMTKPFDFDDLMGTVQRLLEGGRPASP
jgi:DNA-binding response OmpR family regulator